MIVGVLPIVLYVTPIHIKNPKWGSESSDYLSFTPESLDASGILINSFVANAPQVLLSFSYFSFNRLSTSVNFEQEWNGYASYKKALRVTNPQGEQRSTYFLQLPYRWAIPLTISAGILHWLLSQAIFLSRVELRSSDGSLSESGSLCKTGYSLLSLLVFTACFVCFCIVFVLIYFRATVMFLPEAGHCSLVISAACHPGPGDASHHLKKVQWGVIGTSQHGSLEHCSFSSEEVTMPEAGERYR